jgi:hypothetical protein
MNSTGWKNSESIVTESNKFRYNVELHLYQKNYFSVIESRIFSCNEEIKNFIPSIWFKFKDFNIRKTTELISAPNWWLTKNYYVEFIFMSKKEIKKLIKNE